MIYGLSEIFLIIWGLGIGDWGLGIGPIPNPQSPIPNPQSPIPNPQSPIPNPQSPIARNKKILSFVKFIYFNFYVSTLHNTYNLLNLNLK